MAKKGCWFGWLRRLFSDDKRPRPQRKSKRLRWVLGRFKLRQHPALPAPQGMIGEATEKQRKYALTVALATAAAAEAAVAAAQAAAEVVRLTSASQSCHHSTKLDQIWAAIKIQSAFRGYLARKALRALRGLVRLQAIVRGRAVRRQAVFKLKHLQSNADMQSGVKAKSTPSVDQACKDDENKQFHESKELVGKETKVECKSQRRWDYSVLSKEDVEALWLRKQEAMTKRERMMKYSFSHRERRNSSILEESLSNKENGGQRIWIEADKEAYNRKGMESRKPASISSLLTGNIFGMGQVKTGNKRRQHSLEGLNSPVSFPRRSFSRTPRTTSGEDSSIPNSPVFPTYRAATQSAMAKARSLSTPKQRVGFQDTGFDHSLQCNNGLPFWSSYSSESFGAGGRNDSSRHLPASVNCNY